MSNKTLPLDQRLYDYLLSVSVRESTLQKQLREETAADPMAVMQVSPEQAWFMAFLVRLTGARRALEIGVYTGYSALAVAMALPEDGELVACDIDEQWTAIARRYWRLAGVDDRIRLHIAPALDTLDRLLAQGRQQSFDFVFIDADKTAYADYYERALRLLRPGGLILVDNVLWSGAVADPAVNDADTRAIREFNLRVKDDPRVILSMLPLGDGLSLLMKK